MISRLLPLPPLPDHEERQPAWLPRVFNAGKWLLIPLAIFYLVEMVDYFRGLDGFFSADNRILGRDFSNWWTAARLTLDGHIMTLFDIRLYHRAQIEFFGKMPEIKNWSYPPHVLVWFFWLGFLPYRLALAVWVAGTFAAYAFAVAYKRPRPWMLTLILALAPSSCIEIAEAHTGFLTAACLVGGLRMLDEAPVLAGILFGILTFKTHFGLLVPVALMAGRYWKAIASASVTTVILIGISIFIFGTEPWVAYFENTIPLQFHILEVNIRGAIYQHMMISPFMAIRLLGGSVGDAYAVTGVAVLLSIAAVIAVFRRSSSIELCSAVTITATFFGSPYLFTYDTPALSAAIVGMILFALGADDTAKEGRRLQPWHLALFAILWMLPLATISMNRAGLPMFPLLTGALLLLQVQWVMRPSYRHSLASRRPV